MPVVRRQHIRTGGSNGAVWSGLRTIAASRALRRATLVSVISYFGFGMVGVVAPLVGQATMGRAGFGGLLLSGLSVAALLATAVYGKWPDVVPADLVVGVTPLILALGFVLLMTSSQALAMVAMVVLGVADGPQTAALLAVRHRESEDSSRSQVFMTGSSLKIAAASLGMAFAGHLGASSLPLALAVAGAAQLVATTVYFVLP